MQEESGYAWDIFISYPHGRYDEEVAEWVTGIFLDDFRQRLRSSLGRFPEVFIDKEAINPGAQWEAMLNNALARSRILVPIWCINYFESDYCRRELSVMLHRERQLGYRTTMNPEGLIVPIKLWDGDKYPAVAKQIQQLPCVNYSSVRKHSEGHYELRELINGWAPDVAQKIADVPPWHPDWLSREWLDDPFAAYERSEMLLPSATITRMEGMGF